MVVVLPKKFPCLSRIAFTAGDDGHLKRVPNGQWVADPWQGGVEMWDVAESHMEWGLMTNPYL